MAISINQCPLDAFGLIIPIKSIPYIKNDQGELMTFRGVGGTFIYQRKFGICDRFLCNDTNLLPLLTSNTLPVEFFLP